MWRSLLSNLSVPQRNAVVLRHVLDLPITEIVEITGRPAGTVKADISRGLARLRGLMNEEGHR
ncbi:MAG: sigma factor-like helix-turn-helix DNA-binding protein, partial [Acidimicrobiia bacterium]